MNNSSCNLHAPTGTIKLQLLTSLKKVDRSYVVVIINIDSFN